MRDISLFARKLRAWRAGQGENGRMSQEELAELLDVSVDAIGKYERSVSFIRGDLEHRLAEGLGWSRDEILACRQDWESRRRHLHPSSYRLLDEDLIEIAFQGSWNKAIHASLSMASAALGELPQEFAANEKVFVPIYDSFRDHWACVMHKDRMVAKWALPFLLPEDEDLFRTGRFLESELSVERIRQPILPGTYYGYCPAMIVCRGHEAASTLLLGSFVSFLERLAERDVLLHGLGTIACTPGGSQICRDLGMTDLGEHRRYPDFHMWELSGEAISASIFGQRSPLLHRVYAEAFPGE